MIKYRINPEAAKAARARLSQPMVQVAGPAPEPRKLSALARRALRIVERLEAACVVIGIVAIVSVAVLSALAPHELPAPVPLTFLYNSQG